MLRRRRSAGTMANANNVITAAMPAGASSRPPTAPSAATNNVRSISTNTTAIRLPAPSNSPSHRLRLVPHLESRRSLRFDAITRDMRIGDPVLRIGRFTDRSGNSQNGGGVNNNNPSSFKLAFKSKVVSRAHAELWVESSSPSLSTTAAANAKFFIKDTKSSSGTFLNHVRLSPANTESRPFQIKDGDILQLGVDYQGGSEDIYKSVKIRVEIGREWQSGANKFNTTAIKNLKSLAQAVSQSANPGTSKPKSAGIPDCCICLFPIVINQALFISPCSHTFHFKCIRPMVEAHFPSWSCPLCRSFADLEEDVEVEAEMDFEIEDKDEEADLELDAENVSVGGQPRVNGAATDLVPGAHVAEDEDSAVDELSDDPDLHAAIAASRVTANNAIAGPTNPFGNNVNTSTHSNNPFLNMVPAHNPWREPRDGAETEVESDHVGGSTLRPARNARRGHGRNPSAQLVDPLATEGMDEEQDEQEDENVEMLVDADIHPDNSHALADHAPPEAQAMNHDEDAEFVDVSEVIGRDGELEGRSSGSGGETEAAVGAAGAKRKR
ncbi:hypothetical protein GGU10DRAFT_355794 [Lentinula aff. detonsa]|uniref:SMAD/FHA domain-containing protein n=1 Tax=Lentinula aff. detonsa TaxID=2804958 RepID=A0AA38NPJ0_9AGAR|nr:hypothetical protein GGU10DRAFT_355794 [Lentinula aff. detonsa]